ncbi:MAG TPA: hypothetical protein VIT91_03590 [Chthoniobacterales bacterium]
MSLKAFHFVFIVVAILLSAGCAWFGISSYRQSDEVASLIFGVAFGIVALALTGYGVWFFRKSKRIIV